MDRRGEILIEPLYPRGGLLGGASKTSGAPTSKLAALAAARKKKENEKHNDPTKLFNSSAMLLDKLGTKVNDGQGFNQGTASASKTSSPITKGNEVEATHHSRKYPTRLRKSSIPPAQSEPAPSESVVSSEDDMFPITNIIAAPSPFAQTMTGSSRQFFVIPPQPPDILAQKLLHTLHMGNTKSNPFAGPSPDDIVTAAQKSKGSNKVFKEAPRND